jgi:uncharacterized membrane protein (UPF0136 family)
MTAWVILIYGIFVAVGGIMGYAKAQSFASLIAGGISGLVLVVAAVIMLKGSNQMIQIGWWIALTVSLLLLMNFGMRAISNFKMMPGGLMIILSVISIIVLLLDRGGPER